MGVLIIFIILILALLLGLGLTFNPPTRLAGVGITLVGLIIILLMSFTTVGPKNVGVITSFGKISSRTLDPGPHLKAPWQKVTEIDGTMQPITFNEESPLKAKIADGSEVGVYGKIRWNIKPAKANELFGEYRDDDPTKKFGIDAILPLLQASVQESLKSYNPIAQAKAGKADQSFNPDYSKISEEVLERTNKELEAKGFAQLDSVAMTYVSLAPETQNKLNDFVAATGETRIAEQRRETSKAQAEANKILSDSLNKNPNVLVSKCMDTLEKSSESGYQLPAGFSCWPGDNGSVVIPSDNSQK